jgi:hypothetical protein
MHVAELAGLEVGIGRARRTAAHLYQNVPQPRKFRTSSRTCSLIIISPSSSATIRMLAGGAIMCSTDNFIVLDTCTSSGDEDPHVAIIDVSQFEIFLV